MLLDGVGTDTLSDDVARTLAAAGRPVFQVRARDFMRPAGQRFEHGREDAESLRSTWLDAAALEREVLRAAETGRYLPALRDAATDRSARQPHRQLPADVVLLVDGLFLLGRGLPAELTVHVALSQAALLRRGVASWQLPAFAAHDADARVAGDVLVLAEDPRRPAVVMPA